MAKIITRFSVTPSRMRPATFSIDKDTHLTEWNTVIADVEVAAAEIEGNAVIAENSAAGALASKNAAAASQIAAAASAAEAAFAAGVVKWVSGTDYIEGFQVWSPADPNKATYRRIIAGAGAVDPYADPVNWAAVLLIKKAGPGAITLTSTAETNVELPTIGTLLTKATLTQAVTPRTANTILTAADNGNLFDCTGTWTQTIAAMATIVVGWNVYLRNLGTGIITVDPNADETIDGVATGVIYPGMTVSLTRTATGFTASRADGPAVVEIKTSGTSWTAPLGVRRAKVRGCGGGGGGGKYGSSGAACSGGSGAYFEKIITVTPGTAYTYAIGAAGGSQTTAGTAGINGGDTTFSDGVTTCTASGGTGGANSVAVSSFVSGGTATNGDINIPGSSGTTSSSPANFSFTTPPPNGLGVRVLVDVAGPSTAALGYGTGGHGSSSSINSGSGAPGVLILEY